MKIISEDEAKALIAAHPQQGRVTPINQAIFDLEIGQTLFIDKKDWYQKSPPYDVLPEARHQKGSKLYRQNFKVLTVDGGWIVTKTALPNKKGRRHKPAPKRT